MPSSSEAPSTSPRASSSSLPRPPDSSLRSSSATRASVDSTTCTACSGLVRRRAAISPRAASWARSSFAASGPVIASIRRTLAALEPSLTILKTPTSDVVRTCVPPQSSRETSSTSIIRTSSPYFSPKSAIAPSSSALARVVCSARTGWLPAIQPFTRFSTSASSSAESALPWVKSKRSLSGRTAEPACRTCVPSRRRSAA